MNSLSRSDAFLASHGPARRPATDDALDFRQLRHHTKNALQRIIAEIGRDDRLQEIPGGRALLHDLERRVLLSANISDALFGFTERPAPLDQRLRALCENVVHFYRETRQVIAVSVEIDGDCPPALHDALVRATHEMAVNAMQHGMHERLRGTIAVSVRSGPSRVRLRLSDDGWGPQGPKPANGEDGNEPGEGLIVVQDIAARHGGWSTLAREGGLTMATLDLPLHVAGRRRPD